MCDVEVVYFTPFPILNVVHVTCMENIANPLHVITQFL